MKQFANMLKKGLFLAALVVGFFSAASTASAYVTFNQHADDYPTTMVSTKQGCFGGTACDWQTAVTANPGDIVSVLVYYHNTGNQPAATTRTRLSVSPSLGAVAGSYTLTGSVSSATGGSASAQARVNMSTPASLELIPDYIRWYPNGSQTPVNPPGGQGASQMLGSGVSVGTINPGWDTAGFVVVAFRVGQTQQQTYACSDGQDNDGDGLIDMNDPGCSSSTDNSEYNQQQVYACNDGYDNDGDGRIDMNDPGCSSSTDNDEYNQTQTYFQVTTQPATNVSQVCATLNGYVSGGNTSYTRWFQYGTSFGSFFNRTNSVWGSGSTSVSETVCNLQPNTTYYFRLVVEAQNGQITDGNTLSFTTFFQQQNQQGPTAITTVATSVGSTDARLNGLVQIPNGLQTTSWFEYGTTNSLGLSTDHRNIGSATSVNVSSVISLLQPNTTYYYRAVAQNAGGLSRGQIESFRTSGPDAPSVIVRTVTVGGGEPLVSLEIEPRYPDAAIGDLVDYSVHWENISKKKLSNVVLRVQFPREVAFRQSSAGTYSESDHIVTLPIGTLDAGEDGTMLLQGTVLPSARDRDLLVTTAVIVYSATPGVPEEAIDYAMVNIRANYLGAFALFGGGFFPNTLIGWLLLILLVLALVLLARRTMTRREVRTTTFQPPHGPQSH